MQDYNTKITDLPKVSIMIPTYNQAHVIERCVESALGQDYPNLEVVVSDDCSTDDTELVLRKYSSYKNFIYTRNSINLGRVGNYRNTLYDKVSGEWVVNLDGDDYYEDLSFISYSISRILFYISKGKNIVMLQTGRRNKELEHLNENGVILKPNIRKEEEVVTGLDYVGNKYFYYFSHLTTLYNRTLALSLDFYNLNIISSDIESLLKLALNGDVILSQRICGVWVGHQNNTIRNYTIEKLLSNLSYIDGVYDYALEQKINNDFLNLWKKKAKNHMLSILFKWGIYSKKLFFKVLRELLLKHFSFFFSVEFYRSVKEITIIIKRKVL